MSDIKQELSDSMIVEDVISGHSDSGSGTSITSNSLEDDKDNQNSGEEHATDSKHTSNQDDLPKEIREKFPPTTIVLAKVKGYPQWPAMVIDELLLPANVAAMKPKVAKLKKKVIYHLPVRFFSDDTYIWLKTEDMKLLTDDLIEEFFSKSNRRKDKLLEDAYVLAKDPLDMEVFVLYGSKGEPEVVYEDIESEELSIEVSEDPNGDSKKRKKPVQKLKPSSKTNVKPISKAKKVKVEVEIEQDSDWGLDEDIQDNFEQGNYIFEDQQQQLEFMTSFPKSKTITNEYNQIFSIFSEISKQFISQENQEERIELLHDLKKLDIPKLIITKSNLFKILIVINRSHDTSETLRHEINQVLLHWGDLTVEENPEQIPTPNETPGPDNNGSDNNGLDNNGPDHNGPDINGQENQTTQEQNLQDIHSNGNE